MLTRTWTFAVVAGVVLGATAAPAAAADRAATLKRELGPGVRVAEHRGTGLVRFVGTAAGRPIARPAGVSASASPSAAARAFLGRYGSAFGVQARDLRVAASDRGAAGSTVRFQQLRDGVLVLGGELVVSLDGDRNVRSASGEALTEDVATTPRLGSGTARDTALATMAKQHGVLAARLSADIPSLWVYDAGILGGPGPAEPVLVWRVEVKGRGAVAVDDLVLIDARLGAVALQIDQIEHVKDRSVCDAENTASDLPCTAPVRSEGDPPVALADVNLAYDYAGDTYDFYAGMGRDSLDGEGLPLKSTVRYCQPGFACPFANAFWDANEHQMVYGAGYATADDVVGHELTHGVTDFTSHLFYFYQSGAINESLSDVMGELIDQRNGAGDDSAGAKWQMGEDLPGSGAIRDMSDPPAFDNPDSMTSPEYATTTADNGGVHDNSGVNNKAAFLMTDGGTFNGRSVTGLGIDKVARIYYRVDTSLLTSASDYADLGSALQQACADLVGTAGITTANCVEVGDAVAAVEMSTPPAAAPTREAPVCASGLIPTNLFADDLENPASGNWTAQDGWYNPENANPYDFDATYATSGSTNFWGYGAPDSDISIAMNHSVAIPGGAPAYLRFNHAYFFEGSPSTAYDGGMLEYSVNNGATYNDIGPLLTDGGYDGVLTTTSDNPLEGRSAFTRRSNGYGASRATLSSLAGKSVRFRFRIGTDFSGADYGWFVDDVRVYTCSPPLPADIDGDGVADPSDACPSVAAATPNGCPPATTGGGGAPPGGGGAPAGGGPLGSTTTGGSTVALSLKSVKLSSCRLKGNGRRARLKCSFKSFGAITKVSVKVSRKGRVVARGSGKPSGNGLVSIKPRKPLAKGSYKLTIKLTGTGGATRTLTAKLKVR